MTMAQIRDSRLDYLALGHIHKAGMFHAGGTICAWPGCPMGRGFDETGERGVYVTRLGDGYDVRFVPLHTLRFHELELVLTAADGKTVSVYSINGALVEKIDSYASEEITLEKGVYILRVGSVTVKVKM